jgi:hypothetical protein
MVAVGGMIAFVGVLVLVAGIVILLGAALNNYWLAALIVGIVLPIGRSLALVVPSSEARLLKHTAALQVHPVPSASNTRCATLFHVERGTRDFASS